MLPEMIITTQIWVGTGKNGITEHSLYMDMLNLQINLEQQQRTISDLDSLEVANLLYITENSYGTAGAQARGILEYAYGYHFCNCINVTTSGFKHTEKINYGAFNKLFEPEIKVKPNPASEWTSFNYTLPDKEAVGVINISDVNGKLIETIIVSGVKGQKIWNTSKTQRGVYFYTFTVNGISKSGKIVITN